MEVMPGIKCEFTLKYQEKMKRHCIYYFNNFFKILIIKTINFWCFAFFAYVFSIQLRTIIEEHRE